MVLVKIMIVVKVTKYKAHISFFERKKLLMKTTLLCATNLTQALFAFMLRLCV